MNSFVLVAYVSLAASRNLLQQLLACLNFTLDSDLLCWYKQKKKVSMSCGSSSSCWKPWRWVRFDLILLMRDIYMNSNLKPLTKFTSSSRSTEFKDILPWNVFQMITKTISISTRIVISHAMKQDILFWVYWKKLRQHHDQNFPMEGNFVKQILVSEKRNKSKKHKTVRVTVRDPISKVNHLSKTIWDRKIITESTSLLVVP